MRGINSSEQSVGCMNKNTQVTEQERTRIRALYARAGSQAAYQLWMEHEDLVCDRFPDLIKAVAAHDRATHEFTTRLKELIRVTTGS